jgi:hypothetical protein
MKRYTHFLFTAALMLGIALGTASCINDLNIKSIDPSSTPDFDQWSLFVKNYSMLGLTGQKGPAGTPDLDGQDEGESGFWRAVFNCNELMTDECAWAWLNDNDIPALVFINWNSSSPRVRWLYVRLGFNVTQMNYFLDKTVGLSDPESLRQRAETRFLRALHYAYFLDFFGKAPFADSFDPQVLPVEKGGKELYDWIQTELAECETDMYEARQAPYGRADKVANWLLRARLYLNAGVYTGTPDWTNAEKYASMVIGSSYILSPSYEQLFMADNDQNANAMQEIILPIRQDGMKTRNYGGSTYMINATRIAGMPRMGTTNGWSCIFARQSLINKFFSDLTKVPMPPKGASQVSGTDEAIDAADAAYGTRTVDMIAAAKDDRAMFYSGVGGGIRKLTSDAITDFKDGLSIVKWQNFRSDGGAASAPDWADVDIPLFRLAEAYLVRAEANYRLGREDVATSDINTLRRRAHATEFQTNVSEQNIIDEWGREFYLEGRRRSDLIRFGLFTGNKYLWPFKGNVAGGTAVPSFYNRFPIPESDLNNNPNMSQNPGY